jgi:hypothetical protein
MGGGPVVVPTYKRPIKATIADDGSIYVYWDLFPHQKALNFASAAPVDAPVGGVARINSAGVIMWDTEFAVGPVFTGFGSPVNSWYPVDIDGMVRLGHASLDFDNDGFLWVGHLADGSGNYIHRIGTDGTIDRKFGSVGSFSFPNVWPDAAGRFRVEFTGTDFDYYGIGRVACLPDGKILVSMSSGSVSIVFRMDIDGAIEYASGWPTEYTQSGAYSIRHGGHRVFVKSPYNNGAVVLGVNAFDYNGQNVTAGLFTLGRDRWEAGLITNVENATDLFPAVRRSFFRYTADTTWPPITAYSDDPLYTTQYAKAMPDWHPPVGGTTHDWWNINWTGGGMRVWAGMAVTDSITVITYGATCVWDKFLPLSTSFGSVRWILQGGASSYDTTFWNVFSADTFSGSPLWVYIFAEDVHDVGGNSAGGAVIASGAEVKKRNSADRTQLDEPAGDPVTLTAPFTTPGIGDAAVAISLTRTDWLSPGMRIAIDYPHTTSRRGFLTTHAIYEVDSIVDSTTAMVKWRSLDNGHAPQIVHPMDVCAGNGDFIMAGQAISSTFCYVERFTSGRTRVWQKKYAGRADANLWINNPTFTSVAYRNFND